MSDDQEDVETLGLMKRILGDDATPEHDAPAIGSAKRVRRWRRPLLTAMAALVVGAALTVDWSQRPISSDFARAPQATMSPAANPSPGVLPPAIAPGIDTRRAEQAPLPAASQEVDEDRRRTSTRQSRARPAPPVAAARRERRLAAADGAERRRPAPVRRERAAQAPAPYRNGTQAVRLEGEALRRALREDRRITREMNLTELAYHER